jgi:glycosyltransferase involved in cell wall biosynthesis
MRILVVGENFPWPANGGGLIRLANSVEALAGLGDVDLFTLCDPRRTGRGVPAGVTLARVGTTPYPQVTRPMLWRASWAGRSGLPLEVAMRRFDPVPRAEFEAWALPSYDLVWFSTPATYAWLGRPRLGPTVVDLVDLEDEKERQRTTLLRATGGGGGGVDRLRRVGAVGQSWMNARDWRTFQRSVSRSVDRVVLASPLDVERSGLANATPVPNTLHRPEPPRGRDRVGSPPSILFQGSLNYAPNMDAADWFVREIAPRVRAQVADAEVRLVGRPTPGVERLHAPPAVTVVGRVDDMDPELERADLVVVPVRYGSGTRVKILEAFAHRIPVVSTTVGAEGLDVEDGRHLLIADDPDTFAARCRRLLTDSGLRHQLVEAGERLFEDRYTFTAAQNRIRAVAHEVGGSGSER